MTYVSSWKRTLPGELLPGSAGLPGWSGQRRVLPAGPTQQGSVPPAVQVVFPSAIIMGRSLPGPGTFPPAGMTRSPIAVVIVSHESNNSVVSRHVSACASVITQLVVFGRSGQSSAVHGLPSSQEASLAQLARGLWHVFWIVTPWSHVCACEVEGSPTRTMASTATATQQPTLSSLALHILLPLLSKSNLRIHHSSLFCFSPSISHGRGSASPPPTVLTHSPVHSGIAPSSLGMHLADTSC